MSTTFAADVLTLKRDLRQAIGDALATFRKQTGVTPSAIRVDMIEVTARGDEITQYGLGERS